MFPLILWARRSCDLSCRRWKPVKTTCWPIYLRSPPNHYCQGIPGDRYAISPAPSLARNTNITRTASVLTLVAQSWVIVIVTPADGPEISHAGQTTLQERHSADEQADRLRGLSTEALGRGGSESGRRCTHGCPRSSTILFGS